MKEFEQVMNTYLKQGFCLVNGVNPDHLTEVETYVKALIPVTPENNFLYSLLTFDADKNIEISKRITRFFEESLGPVFKEHKFLTGSFLVKPAATETELALHQDWCYTNEAEFTPFTCWTPLMDTDSSTGCIFLIKASQNYFHNYRSNSYETGRFNVADFEEQDITYVSVKRGEILLFNPALWHGSAPNLSAGPRIALTCVMLPQKAGFLYYHKADGLTCRVYKMPDTGLEQYLCNLVKNEVPEQLALAEMLPYTHNKVTKNELLAAIQNDKINA